MSGIALASGRISLRPVFTARSVVTRAAVNDRVLYWGSGSYPCWRVMIGLDEKKLPYEGKFLEFSKREHKNPEIMALNPRGQLPTFKDGDIIINESAAILMHLEHTYPEIPLLTDNPATRAKVLQRFFEGLVTDTRFLSYTYPKRKEMENSLEEQTLGILKNELRLWDGYLSQTEYVAADSFTLADAVFAPFMLVYERFGMTCKDYPNVRRYLDMIKERPSVADNSPPHWKGAEPVYSFMNIL